MGFPLAKTNALSVRAQGPKPSTCPPFDLFSPKCTRKRVGDCRGQDFSNHPLFGVFKAWKVQKRGGLRNLPSIHSLSRVPIQIPRPFASGELSSRLSMMPHTRHARSSRFVVAGFILKNQPWLLLTICNSNFPGTSETNRPKWKLLSAMKPFEVEQIMSWENGIGNSG